MGTSEDGPRLERLIVGALEANCYLVTDRGSGDAVIVDPGNQAKRILDAVRDCQAHVVAVMVIIGTPSFDKSCVPSTRKMFRWAAIVSAAE